MFVNGTQKPEINVQVKYLAYITTFESTVKTDVIVEDTRLWTNRCPELGKSKKHSACRISQNHRMVCIRRDHEDHPVPTPHGQGHLPLDQVAQSPI